MAMVATMPAKEVRVQESAAVAVTEPEPVVDRPVATGMAGIEKHPDWLVLSRIPMRLNAGIPLPSFRVKDLLGLRSGQMLHSTWPCTDDVPLKIGAVQLSWSEFEVVEQRMAVRLTRLA